jgi:hypothetical protein
MMILFLVINSNLSHREDADFEKNDPNHAVALYGYGIEENVRH